MTAKIVETLLVNAAVFSVLFGAMMLVRRLFAKRMSAVLRYVLWAVVAVKLLIPFGFESGLSPLGWFPAKPAQAAVQSSAPVTVAPSAAEPISYVPEAPASEVDVADLPNTPAVASPSLPAPTPLGWADWAMIAWASGAAATGAWLILCMALVRRRMLRGEEAASRRIARILEECKGELGIRRNVGVRLLPYAGVPAVAGRLRPRIIHTARARQYGDAELRHILLHELAHYRHGHLPVIQLMNLLTAVYWFNPLIWLCFGMVRMDMETICDQQALRALRGENRNSYVRTVLKFSAAPGVASRYAALAMGTGRARMERRIRDMFRQRRSGSGTRAAAVFVALAMLASGVLTACQPTPTEKAVQQKNDGTFQSAVRSSAAPGQKYDAPETVKDSEEKGKITLAIEAATDIPDTETFPVYRVNDRMFTQEDADRAIAELMQGKQLYDADRPLTKAQLQEQMLKQLELLKSGKMDSTDESGLAITDKSIKDRFAELIRNAPDSAQDTLGDGTLKKHVAQGRDMGTYCSVAADLGKQDYATLYMGGPSDGDFSKMLPVMRFVNGTSYIPKDPLARGQRLENTNMSFDDAAALAEKTLAGMGLPYMELAGAKIGVKEGNSEFTRGKDKGTQAYLLYFTRTLNGIPFTFAGTATAGDSGWEKEQPAGFSRPWEYERIVVAVDDTGVTQVDWNGNMDILGTLNENAALLPFDNVMEIFKQQIYVKNAWIDEDAGKSATIPIRETIYVERISLGYTRVAAKDSPDEYLLVPVWDFFGSKQDSYDIDAITKQMRQSASEGEDKVINEIIETYQRLNDQRTSPGGFCFLTINAIDGSVIDRNLGY
jgi:beta-lactamase regulating signal transducer with metallopeptidase domain